MRERIKALEECSRLLEPEPAERRDLFSQVHAYAETLLHEPGRQRTFTADRHRPGPTADSLGDESASMEQILDEARADGRFVSLHVEPGNIAKRLYLSLGFEVVGEVSFYQLMHCR